jgi:hypothetical protein
MARGEDVLVASVHEPFPTLYWYFVMGEPPSYPEAKAIEAEPLPAVATSPVGALGAVTGMSLKTRESPLSAMYTVFAESTATWWGVQNLESMAGPGVAGPKSPVPANTERVPFGVTFST